MGRRADHPDDAHDDRRATTLPGSAMGSPPGWVVVGGLLVSTVLTPVVVPVRYRIFTPGAGAGVTETPAAGA